jgi:hypothetical protein
MGKLPSGCFPKGAAPVTSVAWGPDVPTAHLPAPARPDGPHL